MLISPSIGMPAGTTFSTGMNIIAPPKGTGAVGIITIRCSRSSTVYRSGETSSARTREGASFPKEQKTGVMPFMASFSFGPIMSIIWRLVL